MFGSTYPVCERASEQLFSEMKDNKTSHRTCRADREDEAKEKIPDVEHEQIERLNGQRNLQRWETFICTVNCIIVIVV